MSLSTGDLSHLETSLKVTLRDVWLLGQAAEKSTPPPLAKLTAINLPIRAAYWLSQQSEAIDKHYRLVRERWIALIKQHGREVEPGAFQVDAKKEAAFQAAFAELLSEEIEIPGPPILFTTLPDNAQLSASDMTVLGFLFDFEATQPVAVTGKKTRRARK